MKTLMAGLAWVTWGWREDSVFTGILTPRRHGIQMETDHRYRTAWGCEPQDVGGFHMLEKKDNGSCFRRS